MRQKFRDWTPNDKMKVTYYPEGRKGPSYVWRGSERELLGSIVGILEEYAEAGLRLTNRQLYYQLVAADLIPNAMEVYKRICVLLTNARYGGFIDWDILEDRGRNHSRHAEWDGVKSLIESAVSSYRLPRWNGQDYYVEMYTEKDALVGVLQPIADKYHIFFGANRGYSSSAAMYELAVRLAQQIDDGKRVRVLYLGDHDPSGIDMVRDITERCREFFLGMGFIVDNNDFQVIPLALTTEQVRERDLPPNPAKVTDPRADAYIEEFGETSWELDALKPQELQEIAEKGIKEFIDQEMYDAIVEKEKEQIEALQEFGDEMEES